MSMTMTQSLPNAVASRRWVPQWSLLDQKLVFGVAALLTLGVLMVFSASIALADKTMGNAYHYGIRQAIYMLMGMGLMSFMLFIPVRAWEKSGVPLLILGYALLVLVLIPGIGKTVNGSSRWLNFGIMNVQASEPARLCVFIYLAGYLVRRQEKVQESVKGFLLPLFLLGLGCVLLLLEPDFGSSAVMMATALGMLFLAGARLWQFVALLAVCAGALALVAVASPYRMARLTSFLNPWADPFDSGFQLTQSLIAIGRGNWFGQGLGSSVQKLFYLPEAHTDFVFAVYAEEFGLLGVAALVALFGFVVFRIMFVGLKAERRGETFGAYLCYGIAIWVGLQAFLNMGVNMGILPTKGLTLPLMSYGGSSLLVMLAAMALVLRVSFENNIHGVAASEKKARKVA